MTSARSAWPQLWAFVRPYRIRLVLTLLLSLLATPLTLASPLPLKIAVDSLIGNQPMPAAIAALVHWLGLSSLAGSLALLAVFLLLLTLLTYVQGLLSWIAQTWLGEKLALDLRAALFNHAQRLSLAYHDRTGTTDSVYRIQYDAASVQHIIVNGVIPLTSSVLTLCGMVVVTALIDRELALVALITCPVLYAITRTFNRRLRDRWFQVKSLDSSAMSVVQEVLSSMRVVKAFGQEEREQGRFLERSNDRLSGEIDVARIQGSFDLAVGMTIACGTAAALAIGVLHTKAGLLTIGQLFLVMAYLAQIYEPMKTISRKVADLQSGLASAHRALTLLDELPEVQERHNAIRLDRAQGHVCFENLTFAYQADRPILSDVGLDVPAGTCVGIRGHSGVGKTTLISLLTRFYDPTAGRITLDGIDLRDYQLRDLRSQFAIVLQDPILFSTTIEENIAYGRRSATHDEVVRAARAANAHTFIAALPDGYRTQVGERGMRLSGGERQRISMARAFLKDAPILLLDEPTSSVDAETEGMIMDAMRRLVRGRTVFLIAHRLSTLAGCDLHIELAGSTVRIIGHGQVDRHP